MIYLLLTGTKADNSTLGYDESGEFVGGAYVNFAKGEPQVYVPDTRSYVKITTNDHLGYFAEYLEDGSSISHEF